MKMPEQRASKRAATKNPEKNAESVDARIQRRIQDAGRGTVVVPSDFLDLGSRRAVDVALHRLAKKGTLRRLGRGLYDYPRTHPTLGELAPSTDEIARALAGKARIRLQPSGAYAANLLRLSEQVPMKVEFLTDGPSRKVKLGTREISLKRTTPRNMATAGRASGLVIQALRYIGKDNVSMERIAHLRTLLTEQDRQQVLEDLPLAPAWMHPYLRAIASDEPAT
jgi:hypothetical protein